jgi:aspartyl-tRNA(Asn)/glutamyl-tRNA(Gln) amidotransferase subunit A
MQNITDLSRKLRSGRLTARALVEQALARIDKAEDPRERIFLSLYREAALVEAELVDRARAAGLTLPAHAGIPIATKDLFDIAGEVTRAGSRVLDDQPPAKVDAPAMTRLRRAGFIIIGKATMTEFAYSGLGVNAHFGTPRNPRDTAVARIPGGSSSGAGVAVAADLVPAAIGTDTGGSCRVPAAFCGIVGFKPTSTRVPRAGVVPLSTSLDCIGPLATSVSCCAVLDSILSTGEAADVESMPEGGLRIAVLEGYPTERMDDAVGAARDAALTRLSGRGVRLSRVEIPELAELPTVNAKGGLVGAEAYAWHRPHLARAPELYDAWVRARFAAGKSQSAADYIDVLNHRARIRAAVATRTEAFDAILLPTVQILPPTIAELDDSDHSNATNLLCLRNTAIGNFLDLPSISIPCQSQGSLPVGLMLMGRTGEDRRLLSIARGLEHLIRGH